MRYKDELAPLGVSSSKMNEDKKYRYYENLLYLITNKLCDNYPTKIKHDDYRCDICNRIAEWDFNPSTLCGYEQQICNYCLDEFTEYHHECGNHKERREIFLQLLDPYITKVLIKELFLYVQIDDNFWRDHDRDVVEIEKQLAEGKTLEEISEGW
jgi:hypothetical protein